MYMALSWCQSKSRASRTTLDSTLSLEHLLFIDQVLCLDDCTSLKLATGIVPCMLLYLNPCGTVLVRV